MATSNLLFNNVRLLGYSHENNFFGENSFSYSAKKTISLRGYVLDLLNYNGVKNTLEGFKEIRELAQSFQQIKINNLNFGRGKVTSLTIDSGNWVRTTEFSATIEILEAVPLQNINSPEFNNLQLNSETLKLIKSFSENFSVDFDTQNKILGGEHTLEIELDSETEQNVAIDFAQLLAGQLLRTLPTQVAEGNYTTRNNFKVLSSEEYNLSTGKCGFSRKFSYSTENTNKPYSIKLVHSIQLDNEGICKVTENCSIKAESDTPSLYENAKRGLNDQLSGNFFADRINPFFLTYKDNFEITRNLNNLIVSKSVQINKFLGTIDYEIVYDNDFKKVNTDYQFEYSSILERDEQGISTISEEGSITGIGVGDYLERYRKAERAWGTIKTIILRNSFGFSGLKQISKRINKSQYKGSITYKYSYTDDPRVKENDPNGIKKQSIEISDIKPSDSPILKEFITLGRGSSSYNLVQDRGLKEQGTYSAKVQLEIGCLNTIFKGSNYFTRIINNKNSYGLSFGGNGEDHYIESAEFTSDEVNKVVTFNVTYKYS